MTPRQLVAMVLCSVAVLGIAGGLPGLPVGKALHHRILTSMTDIAAKTVPPPSFFDVFRPLALSGLVLGGIGIAVTGAGCRPAGRRGPESPRCCVVSDGASDEGGCIRQVAGRSCPP